MSSLRYSINDKLKRLERHFITYNNIYVSKGAVLNNFDVFMKLSPGDYVIPVLKANAYGHGLQEVAGILKSRNFPYIAVDGYFEALRIHEVSNQGVLVMGAINPANFSNMNLRNCAFVVHDIDMLKAIGAVKKNIKIHLELETGMGRHGLKLDKLGDFLGLLKKYPKLTLDGVMSHLADADNPKSEDFVTKQTLLYDHAVKNILSSGFVPKYFHIAQTAGSTKAVSRYANTLRIGIGLYGINPLDAEDAMFDRLSKLKPALKLVSTIGKVLDLEEGSNVSYGCTYTTSRKSRIGVLPLGYYEGLPRALSNRGKIKYKNNYLPIVGRVCMNHTMIDLTDSTAKFGDEVVVISNKNNDLNSVNQIAKDNNLFNYELLVGLNETIRRTVVA